MTLKFLLVEMLQQIRFKSGTEAQVDAYLTEWYMANQRPSMRMPCPLCFLEGEAQQLNLLEVESEISKVGCARCSQNFVFASPRDS